jgi:hypothetical protein
MSTQTGTIYLGTFGLPVEIQLGANLTGTTQVALAMRKPSGALVNRNLGAGAVTDAAGGKVSYFPIQTEVNEAGVYTFSITVTLAAGKQLVGEGSLVVSPSLAAGPTLVVEDGTGLDDANSYATRAEADAYHEGHLYADAWLTATNAQKERALIMATRLIDDNVFWKGAPVNVEPGVQALGWPRVPRVLESRYGNPVPAPISASFWETLAWPYNQVPRPVMRATCELARELLKADRTLEDSAKGIRSVSVGQGAVDVVFDPEDRKSALTDLIAGMLKPYGTMVAGQPSEIRVTRG